MGKRIIAIDQAHAVSRRAAWWLWFSVLAVGGLISMMPAHAGQVVGSVTDVSGPMVARRADGTIKALTAQSAIEQGDTLVTEEATYARIKFIDNGEITLRPNTQFKIENFSYEAAKPESDNAFFTLLKGGLRSITGLLGKRNHDRFGLNTPTATIGIRGTVFIAEYVPPSNEQVAAYQRSMVADLEPQYGGSRSDAPRGARPLLLAQNNGGGSGNGLNPGLYVQVLEGLINVHNGGGSQNFAAGQFGFTPSFTQPPVILPNNPGLQFNPPPSFSNTGGTQNGNGGKPGDVDCIVR
ncbi:MAG TPA: FecR family protein [Burkholderiaceae bacterium]